MPVLTLATIERKGACPSARADFAQLFGASVEVTTDLCIEHASTFDWDWASAQLLRASAQAEYDRVRAPAQAEYDRVRASAQAEYDRVRAPAWAEYNRVCAQAGAEYDRVCAPAWAEYNRVCAPAWAEYDRVRAAAFSRLYTGLGPEPMGLGHHLQEAGTERV